MKVSSENQLESGMNEEDLKSKYLTINYHQYLTSKYKNGKNSYSYKKILAQTMLTSAVMLTSAGCGMPIGYSAILLPQLKAANDSMHIDDEMGSWIASVHSAATPFGSLLSGLLMDQIGRKFVLQISSVPLIIGWILICISKNHTILLLGRLIAGLSAGLSAAAGQVLISESTEPELRGILSSAPLASYSFGILLVYALGSFWPWKSVAGLSIILPVLSIIVFVFLPESPVFLTRKKKSELALKNLIWLRGGNLEKAVQERDHLLHRIKNENNLQSTNIFKIFLTRHVMKPLLILNVFNILQILSGTYLIVFYAVDVISQMGRKNLNHFLAASLSACARFIFTIIATLLLGLIGRRKLALLSGIGTGISAICLAVALHPECRTSDNNNNYLTAVLILVYVAANTVGFFVLPGVMLGELFPAKIRGHAGGLTFMIFNFILFAIAKIFPLVKNAIGIDGVFWIFGISSLIASGFLYAVLPETKDKTLSYIEDYFQQNNFIWIKRDKNWENKFLSNETENSSILKI